MTVTARSQELLASAMGDHGAAANIVDTIGTASFGTTGLQIDQHFGAIHVATDAATVTFNLSLSDWHIVTLTASRTVALTNPTIGQQFFLIFKQGGTGSYGVTWFSGITWPSGIPGLSTDVGDYDVFVFKCIAANTYLGFPCGGSGTSVALGLTATGVDNTDALDLVGNNSIQEVTTTAAGTGVSLPVPSLPASVFVINQGANALEVYPPSGGTINAGSADVAFTLAAGGSIRFTASSTTNYYTEFVPAAILDQFGITRGSMLYRGAGGWTALTPGTSGQILTSQGAGADPHFVTAGAITAITSLTGDVTASGTGAVAATFVGLTSVITPTALAASVNDWAPTNLATANHIKISATAYVDITGLSAAGASSADATKCITNVGSAYPIALRANSSLSSAANRFNMPADSFLLPGMSAWFQYDVTNTIWHMINYRPSATSQWYPNTSVQGPSGDVTISSGTTTLTDDTSYRKLTISGTGKLRLDGFRLFCEFLDISAAPALAIVNLNSSVGGSASGANGGTVGAAGTPNTTSSGTTVNGTSPTAGGTATTTTGGNGTAAPGAGNGGAAGVGGVGGASGTNTAGTAAATGTANNKVPHFPTMLQAAPSSATALNAVYAGQGGGGGSAGGGDGTNKGGSGGGGGTGGPYLHIYARFILRGASTTAGAISAVGKNGGVGGICTAAATNLGCGGGGGGAGGGGGCVYIVTDGLLGATGTNAIDVTGGNGGAGGAGFLNGSGTATGGNGGGAGQAGRLVVINAVTGAVTDSGTGAAAVAGNSFTLLVAGTGATATSTLINL